MSALPTPVATTLDSLVEAAKQSFGDDLESVVLYGSAAENRLRATSDVNVLFVLARFEEEKANAFRSTYRFAQAAVQLQAMFVCSGEIAAAAGEFAQKFADIARRHVVLYGRDPFEGLEIPRKALVEHLRQVLLNQTMRLRELYIERSLREEQCAVTLAEAAGPLRTSAASILELEGRGTLPPKEALAMIVRELGKPELEELLPHISEAREERALPAGRAAALLFQGLELARVLYERATRL